MLRFTTADLRNPSWILRGSLTPAGFALLGSLVLGACSDARLDAFRSLERQVAGGRTGDGSGGASVTSGGQAQGASGTGVMEGGTGGAALSATLLLDDFEDGNTETLLREGWWYQTIASGEPQPFIDYGAGTTRSGASTRALRSWGSVRNWYFVGLDPPGQPNLNATSFTHIRFFMRAGSGAALRTLDVQVFDSTRAKFHQSITLEDEFTEYLLAFEEFAPDVGAAQPRINTAEFAGLQFWAAASESFEFFLDDVSLVAR